MSAITGIFYRDRRRVDPELIKKMNDRLSHRGPDGSDTWCEGSVALGHQMLWTTPESLHEKLPFEESGLVITADARIDNRKELSEKLSIEDKEDVSDSYFILKSYEKWGEKCPEHLLGDFAFAIWDKNEEKLFCARDHMGVKPFYYYLDDEMFVFGTEIKALFCVPGVPCELNELKVALFLMKILEDKKYTFYDKIIRLSASTSLTLNQNNEAIKMYWKLNPKSRIILSSNDDYFNAFSEIFAEAVRCRLRSHYTIGFELSGGLDSSSIVCMAKKILDNPNNSQKCINTFSHIFPDVPISDERYYIQKVVDIGKIKPHFLRSDIVNPIEYIEKIMWHNDQPFDNPHMSMIWNLFKEMQKNSIRVMLSGAGGDGTISHGNYYLKELAITFQWKKLIMEINALSKHLNQTKLEIITKRVIFPLFPENLKNWLVSLKSNGNSKYGILNKDFFKKLYMLHSYKNIRDKNLKESLTPRKYHYYLMSIISHQSMLENLDPSVAAFSIEPRYPFLDKRLVEFCFAIPTEIKFSQGWIKYILRKSMENILPKEVAWCPKKTKMGPVFKKNFVSFEENFLEDNYDNNTRIGDYVDLNILKEIYSNYKLEKGGDLFNMWLYIVLYLWMQKTGISV